MSERSDSRGPNWALLLLIPAAVVVAKGVAHRHAMWDPGWTPEGGSGHGHSHGRHRRFGGDMEASTFRLPPKIEWMLETWHTRAHQRAEVTGATDATAPGPGSETA